MWLTIKQSFMLTCMCNSQWDSLSLEWNLVFWPNEFNNLIPSEAILRSPSAARRSKAKRGIRLLSEWEVKNKISLETYGYHCELYTQVNMKLCFIVGHILKCLLVLFFDHFFLDFFTQWNNCFFHSVK